MRITITTTAALLLAAQATASHAQSGTLEGGVTSDSLGKHSLPGALITIPALNLVTQANFAGEYRLTGIAPGQYLVIARAAGFQAVGDSVVVAAGSQSYHDFVMLTRTAVLDSVVSTAASPVRKFISPALTGFEQRSKEGFGHFVPDTILRKEDTHELADVINAHVPGVDFQRVGARSYLTSQRGMTGPLQTASCYPDVYLDGVPLSKQQDPQVKKIVAVDLHQFSVATLGGIEFYAGGATLPIQLNHTASGCGALLLWTRER